MEKETRKMMYEEKKKLLEQLSSMDPESDEYATVLRRIKDIDCMTSNACKQDEEKKERYFKYGVEAGLGLLTLGFNWTWMKKGFKFEETGALVSKTFRDLTKGFSLKLKK